MVANVCIEALERGPNFRGWLPAGKLAVALSTDGVDGFLGRQSNIPSPEYARKDRDYDKLVVYMLYGTLGMVTEDSRYFSYLMLNLVRDNKADKTREQLIAQGLNGACARPLGRNKMRAQTTGLVADFSPIGDIAPELVHGIHMSAAVLTVVSGFDIERNAKQQLADFANSSDTPDEFRDVLAYTSQVTA